MRKLRFKTKLTKQQKRKDIIVFLAVFVCLYIFVLMFGFSIGIFKDWTALEPYVMALFLFFFIVSMLIFPLVIAGIVLGMQKGNGKRVRDDATFVPVQNLLYYRDSLSNLTPALVSLLVDMDIYGKKDIAATLLRMQRKGIISFDKKRGITVQVQNIEPLDSSERELLEIVKAGKHKRKPDKKTIMQWRINRFSEAEKLGYVEKKSVESKLSKTPLLLGTLSIVVGYILWGWSLWSDMFVIKTPIELLRTILLLLMIDILFFTPVYLLTKWSAYNKRFKAITWERTELGNETAEKIYGLARFIHEFSMLSEAHKEQVALWDDYLVYAVVLEENEQIVNDISKYYKIDINILSAK